MYKKEGIKNVLFYKTTEVGIDGKPKETEKEFNLKDFDIGFTVTGKLAFHHVKGGVILIPSDFSIIEQKFISNFKH